MTPVRSLSGGAAAASKILPAWFVPDVADVRMSLRACRFRLAPWPVSSGALRLFHTGCQSATG